MESSSGRNSLTILYFPVIIIVSNTLTEITDAESHPYRQNVVTQCMTYYDLRANYGSQVVVDSVK